MSIGNELAKETVMAWLVGIVCIILLIVFWRIFVPLVVVLGVAVVIWIVYENNQTEKRERIQAQKEQAIRAKMFEATRIPADDARTWTVSEERDPASGARVPRSASVVSDGDICVLQVEQRINGTKLTGLYCSGLQLRLFQEIEVKFDHRANSDRMRIERFSDGTDSYISSNQYSQNLNYEEFVRRLAAGKKVALQLEFEGAGRHWIAFTLSGAPEALQKIGAVPRSANAAKTAAKREEISPTAPSVLEKGAAFGRGTEGDDMSAAATKSRGLSAGTRLPLNAELDYTGNNWKCRRGYRRVGDTCVEVTLPPNAELDYTGSTWKCVRGFRRTSSGECTPVDIPLNAELDYTGSNWKCQRGYRRTSTSECAAVVVPPNAELDYTGSDWKCSRGYTRVATGCAPVQIPENAELDYTGNAWKCQRGYRRQGNGCAAVGIAAPT